MLKIECGFQGDHVVLALGYDIKATLDAKHPNRNGAQYVSLGCGTGDSQKLLEGLSDASVQALVHILCGIPSEDIGSFVIEHTSSLWVRAGEV